MPIKTTPNSLNAKQEMTNTINNTNGGHGAAHNSQQTNHKIIDTGLLPPINNINGLDFRIEVKLLFG
jgi:hypothetical protein